MLSVFPTVHYSGYCPAKAKQRTRREQKAGERIYTDLATPRAAGRVLESRWTRMILAYILAVPVFVLMLLFNVVKRYK